MHLVLFLYVWPGQISQISQISQNPDDDYLLVRIYMVFGIYQVIMLSCTRYWVGKPKSIHT